LVLVAILPLIGLVAFDASRAIARQRHQTRERAQARARLTAARIDTELGNIDALLLALAKMISPAAADVARNEQLFAAIQSELPAFYLPIQVHTVTGDSLAAGPPGPNVAGQRFFREAFARRGFAIGDLQRSDPGGKWTVTLARPILDSTDSPSGLISIAIDLVRMGALLNTDDLPGNSLISVVDANNVNVARSREPEMVGRPTADQAVIGAALRAREGSVEFTTTKGSERLAGYATCTRAPWLVFVRVWTNVAFAEVNREAHWSFGLVGAALGASLLLAWFLADHIARPIRSLAAEATAFGDSAHQPPSKVNATGEIGVLARAFDRMATAVAQRDVALREGERRYRTLVEWLPDAVAVHRHAKVIFVNPAAMAMLGARQPEELIGTDILAHVHPSFRTLAAARVQAVLDSNHGLPAT
jgi:PAS domain-containing protein